MTWMTKVPDFFKTFHLTEADDKPYLAKTSPMIILSRCMHQLIEAGGDAGVGV